MASPFEFFRQVRSEVTKVFWPSRKETIMSAVAVLLMVSIVACFLFFVDQILSFAIRLILNIGA